jgi:hypothetical protein
VDGLPIDSPIGIELRTLVVVSYVRLTAMMTQTRYGF